MKKKLAILGASGHGKVIADIAESSGWDEVVLFDDAWPELMRNGSWEIQGDGQTLCDNIGTFNGVFVAIGNNEIREKKVKWLTERSAPLVSLVHPTAVVSRHAEFGVATVIMPSAVLNAGAKVGDGVILNTGSIVDHDCSLEDFTHISPGATLCGGVTVGRGAWIGANTVIREGIVIGENALLGAGSVVVKNISFGQTVFGCPAE